jgi:thymidylate synthase (FAD)
MCEIKLHVRVPMDAWRQWIRHRTSNVNEYSTRYSVAIDGAQMTPSTAWRLQSAGNRQGSAGFVDDKLGSNFSRQEADLHELSRRIYNERIEAGVAREQARKDLPLSTYTEAYWKCDLHNLLHFLSLRMDEHAQLEIRDYASLIGNEIVSKWCPIVWEAFLDYRMNAMGFSGIETEIIQRINAGDATGAAAVAEKHGWLEPGKSGLKRNREREELEAKLLRLNLAVPWR